MIRISALFLATSSILASAIASADDAQCSPMQNGNTWNLVCAANGQGEATYACDYFLSVTNSQGSNDVVEATGSVGAGQSGMIIWSAIQDGGADIVSVGVNSGSCIQQ